MSNVTVGFFEDPPVEPPVEPPVDDKNKTFTQDHVNSLVAKERKEWQAKLKKSEDGLTSALKAKGLTEAQRNELQTQLEDVQKSLRTKEEQTEHERTESARKHKEAVDSLTTDRETWKNRYTKASIQRAILDGAMQHDAYDPEQVVALLGPNTELAEEIDAGGKKTGNLVPKTSWDIPDKDGKIEKISGSPSEIIEKMTKHPKKWGNLFKNKSTGGLGTMPNAGSGSVSENLSAILKDPAKYREERAKGNIPGVRATGKQHV